MTALPVIRLVAETPEHHAAIDAITDEAFGPARYVKAAERVRERVGYDPALSAVALFDGMVVGSVRQSWLDSGEAGTVMLGPLAVRPWFKGQGAGRALMREAERLACAAGAKRIVLVGDAAYYGPLGYAVLPAGSLALPRPVDPARVLGLSLDA